MRVEQAARGEGDFEPCPQSARQLRQKPRVFILQDFYLPGENVGGPVWTIANMVERVGDRFFDRAPLVRQPGAILGRLSDRTLTVTRAATAEGTGERQR